jgi:hypothetical protein
MGALAGELETAPAFTSGALLRRSGGAGGLSPPRGFFLLGFHRLRFETACHYVLYGVRRRGR